LLGGGMADPYAQPQNRIDMGDEQLGALLATYGDTQELDQMRAQLERVNALRDAPGPEGIQAGRTYVAASPLSHIGSAVQSYRAAKKAKELEGERPDDVDEKTGEKRKSTIYGQIKKVGGKVAKYGEEVLKKRKDEDD
jgi:hypothetical protein